jgi:hypothetical protein
MDRFGDGIDGYGPPPVRSGGGCMRGCVITMVVVAVLMVIGVGVMGFLAYRFFGKAMSTDPVEIRRRIDESIPGAKVPEGYDPKFNMKLDMGFMKMNMSVIADKEVELKNEGDIQNQEKGTVFMLMSIEVANDNGQVRHSNGPADQLKVMERKKIQYQAGPYVFEGYRFKATTRKDVEIEGLEFELRKGMQLTVHATGEEALDEDAVRQFLESCGPGLDQKKGKADGSDKPFGVGKPRERKKPDDKPGDDVGKPAEGSKPAAPAGDGKPAGQAGKPAADGKSAAGNKPAGDTKGADGASKESKPADGKAAGAPDGKAGS